MRRARRKVPVFKGDGKEKEVVFTQELAEDTLLLIEETNAAWATLEKQGRVTPKRRQSLCEQIDLLTQASLQEDSDLYRYAALQLFSLLDKITRSENLMPEDYLVSTRSYDTGEDKQEESISVAPQAGPENEMVGLGEVKGEPVLIPSDPGLPWSDLGARAKESVSRQKEGKLSDARR